MTFRRFSNELDEYKEGTTESAMPGTSGRNLDQNGFHRSTLTFTEYSVPFTLTVDLQENPYFRIELRLTAIEISSMRDLLSDREQIRFCPEVYTPVPAISGLTLAL